MHPADTPLDRPRLYVDFNEMVERDLVLLSAGDVKTDSSGSSVLLREGLVVDVYMDDIDDKGCADPLIASGVAELTAGRGWAPHGKWGCRINPPGIHHLSEVSV